MTSEVSWTGPRSRVERGGCGASVAAATTAPPTPPKPTATAEETLKTLGSSRDAGLTKREAGSRREKQGPNEVPAKPSHAALRLAKKFWGLSAWMIELIVILSIFLHKYADVWVALSLLVGNAVLSFFQEQRASTAVTLLRSKLQITARVLRERAWLALPARELVAGDVVRVRSGDFVPADIQLFEGDL
jgi:H+-transporting ATPase